MLYTHQEPLHRIQEQVEPLICRLLGNLSDAWGLHSPIQALPIDSAHSYGWFIQGNGLSVVMQCDYEGDALAPSSLQLELGKLARAGSPFGPVEVLQSYPLTEQGFQQAVDCINEKGPGYFYNNPSRIFPAA